MYFPSCCSLKLSPNFVARFACNLRSLLNTSLTTISLSVMINGSVVQGENVSSVPQQLLRVVQDDRSIAVYAGAHHVFTYNVQSPPPPAGIDPVFERSGFLHPVSTPAGACVTASFPADHEHQQGIFSAWTRTIYNGEDTDFWNLAKRTGRVVHEQVVSTEVSPEMVRLEVNLLHQKLGEPMIDVLRERWSLTVHATTGDYFCFDIESHQTALTELPLQIPKYIYGGQGYRGPVAWLQPNDSYAKSHPELSFFGSVMINDASQDRIDGNHTHSKWVAIQGAALDPTGELLRSNNAPATLAVLGHRDNFRAPQAVRLHPTKPYFCFSPCVDADMEISKAQPYKAKYRYLTFSKPIDASWIEQQWIDWHNDSNAAAQ